MERYLPPLAGITFATIWGFSFMFTKGALDVLAPFHLLGFRFLVAAIVLILLKVCGIIRLDYRGKNLRGLFLLGLVQPGMYFVCETVGVKLTSSSEAGMLIALIPVVVTIMAAIFLKETATKMQGFFIILSVIGAIFIIVMGGGMDGGSQTLGTLALVGAVLSASIYNVMSRSLSKDFTPVEITFSMMLFGAVIFNAGALIQHLQAGVVTQYFAPLANVNVLWAVAYLGTLSSIVAFFAMNYMLGKIEASRTAVFTNLVTVIAIFAGVIFLGEPFYWFHIVGSVMILLGVWGTNYFQEKKDFPLPYRIKLRS